MAQQIRNATLQDLKGIKAIDETVFGADTYPLFVLRQLFDISGSFMKVAEVDGALAGYTLGSIEQDSGTAWFLSLGVLPGFRGLGVGTALVAALLEEAQQKGAKRCKLTVMPANSSGLSIYKQLGFTVAASEADYYLDDASRLVMEKLLGQE